MNRHPGVQHLPASRRFPNGGWVVRYRDGDNMTQRKTFEKKADAIDFQAKVRHERNEGTHISERKSKTPFREVAEAWFEKTRPRYREKTAASYRSILDSHLLPHFRSRPIGKIRTDDIERFLNHLDVSTGTRRNILNVLNPIMKSAMKAGLIRENPCSLVDMAPVERKDNLFLTPDQIQQLADAITPRYRTLVLAAAATGLRAGELAALRVRNLDLLRARLHVKESVSDVGGVLHYGKPKTEKSKRQVGISRFLVDLLAHEVAGKRPDDLVFTGPNGAPLRHSNYYQRHFRPAVEKLVADGTWPGELFGLRFHDLRHSHASILIDQGVHPKLISDRLGHKSISITMDIYGHKFPDKEDAIAAGLDDVFTSQKPQEAAGEVVTLG